jgi:hypothetical protein
MAKRITADEFEAQYAERSGLSIAELRASGRVVVPCHCDYEGCEGWQQVSRESVLLDLGILDEPSGRVIDAAAGALRVAGDFEATMRQVATTAGATPAEVARLSAQVEEMAR